MSLLSLHKILPTMLQVLEHSFEYVCLRVYAFLICMNCMCMWKDDKVLLSLKLTYSWPCTRESCIN